MGKGLHLRHGVWIPPQCEKSSKNPSTCSRSLYGKDPAEHFFSFSQAHKLLRHAFAPSESFKKLNLFIINIQFHTSLLRLMSLNITYNDIFHNMSLIWKFHFGEPRIKKKITQTQKKFTSPRVFAIALWLETM